jgi:uncharacterized membrane protein YjgN (DUF898 family)
MDIETADSATPWESHPEDRMSVNYTGEKGPLFSLSFKTGLLTILTLGIYRFWQKTRIRKYVWSSVNVGGDTLEYTGTGMEKFLGFLVAIVFLAVYLGIIQMVLFYFGIQFMFEPETPQEALMTTAAFYISFFAVLPFIYFAVYRSRRYKMARTRFRGIRCGMEKGAWGYVARALGYGFLTMISLGILAPLAVFRLEKYMTDRSYYGSARFTQNGKWTKLYGAMKHVFIGLAFILVGGGLIAFGGAQDAAALAILGGVGMFVGYIWIIIGSVYFGVRSFGYLTSHKALDGEVTFVSEPRTGHVIKTYLLGLLLLSVLASVAFGIVGILVAGFMPMMQDGNPFAIGVIAVVGVVGYLVGLVVIQALNLVLIFQPILGHYLTTITVENPAALDGIRQRAAETGLDADGFADALDIGGAI